MVLDKKKHIIVAKNQRKNREIHHDKLKKNRRLVGTHLMIPDVYAV